ncbi:MAG: glycosyltransferase family 4 protein [Candidatus Omnitrophota bacterium]
MTSMAVKNKIKVLVCGVLPPPTFGHSKMYAMLMASSFPDEMDVKFLNMHFWSYATNKKVTSGKLVRMLQYYGQYVWYILSFRPKYVLYNMSFYKMPFLKDFLFCATGILLGRRVVMHDMGQYVRELYDGASGWQKAMLRWMLKHMAASIVMGERVRPVYEGLADSRKIVVVPGVVEDTKDVAVEPDRREGLLNVVYFSHMSRAKGILTAFEAAVIILEGCHNVMISFAGPVEDEDILSRLKELQGRYPDRVRYLGYIEDEGARTAIFRGADVFMFTTLRDVFGLVLLHAMAEGKPVVASLEGTIPEIVVEGKTGLLFEKGNARACAGQVLELLSDEPLRHQMGAAGRKRFEDVFALEKYGKKMAMVFNAFDQ